MIDTFFKQTNETIWGFLQEIGKSKEVFSCYSFREIDGYTLFFYATSTEIVLVLLDIVDEGTVEYAEDDSRLSPVMELYEHARQMRRFFEISGQFKLVPAIHLMYLTNAHIVNYPKMMDTWQQQDLFGFSALHDLSGLRPNIIYESRIEGHPFIPVNEDLSIEASEYWTKWQTYLRNRGHFDGDDYRYDDWPRPTDKRYSWKGEKGHLISDEFKNKV